MKSPRKKNKKACSHGPVGRRRDGPQAGDYRSPFVAVTFAMTVDGKITTKNFTPVDFTSREDKTHLFRQRALGDAVLIGHSTLKHDNVRLGLPDPKMREARVARGQTPYPLRVIVSNEGRIDTSLKNFKAEISPIVIFSTVRMPARYPDGFRKKSTLHPRCAPPVQLP